MQFNAIFYREKEEKPQEWSLWEGRDLCCSMCCDSIGAKNDQPLAYDFLTPFIPEHRGES